MGWCKIIIFSCNITGEQKCDIWIWRVTVCLDKFIKVAGEIKWKNWKILVTKYITSWGVRGQVAVTGRKKARSNLYHCFKKISFVK